MTDANKETISEALEEARKEMGMADRERVIYDLERCICHVPDACRDCSKFAISGVNCMESLMEDALALIREQEPRVLTLEEVIRHYSMPPVFVDDLGAQEDYLQDITPLYFDFPEADTWAVHWRGYYSARKYIYDWEASYGKKWRCWTARPTDEQRQAVKWDEA